MSLHPAWAWLLIAALLAGCDRPQTPEQAASLRLEQAAGRAIGTPLPPFTFERLGGGAIDPTALQGKTTLLNFWAPGCPPCVQELPVLASLHETLQGKGIQVLGIALAPPEEVEQFLAEHPLPYPILLGLDEGPKLSRELGNAYGVLPYSIVVDGEGMVRAAHAGRLDEKQAQALLDTASQVSAHRRI